MAELATGAAWLLAVVFGWAALAKVRDRSGTAASLRALGLPAPGALATALPIGEAGVAALLLTAPRLGAVCALAALTLFALVLADRLRRGVRASCGCFGAASDEPITWLAVVRNGLLAAAAVVASFGEGAALPTLPGVVAASTAALVGTLVLALAGLTSRTGRLFSLGALPPLPEPAEGPQAARRMRT